MDGYTGYSGKKWGYFTASINHRQLSVTLQSAGCCPVSKLCAVVTHLSSLCLFTWILTEIKGSSQHCLLPPFPPAMTSFWWAPPCVLQPAQIQWGCTHLQHRAEPSLQAPCPCPGVTLAMGGCRISPAPLEAAPAACTGKSGQYEPQTTLRSLISFQTRMLFNPHYSNCNFYCTKSSMATRWWQVLMAPAPPAILALSCGYRISFPFQPDSDQLPLKGSDCWGRGDPQLQVRGVTKDQHQAFHCPQCVKTTAVSKVPGNKGKWSWTSLSWAHSVAGAIRLILAQPLQPMLQISCLPPWSGHFPPVSVLDCCTRIFPSVCILKTWQRLLEVSPAAFMLF